MSSQKPGPTDSSQPAKRRRLPSWIQDILDRPSSPPWPQLWSIPEDPDKPDLPYTVGFAVDIRRERAPPTAAIGPELPRDYFETVPHSEAVLAGAPVKPGPEADPNTEPADHQNEIAQLVITALIAIGAERGAQVVSVTVTPKSQDTASCQSSNAVAKIYDPLYYSFESRIGHHPEDCVYSAGRDYIHEATAYEHLRLAGQTGTFAPEYYGCWSFNLSITIRGSSQTRSINLILMESLEGNSILSTRIQNNPDRPRALDSFHYPEEFRLEVLARAMDGYVRLLRAGIAQGDFAARNLILARDPTTTAKTVHGHILPRVVLVDYNLADIFSDQAHDGFESLPANPASVFWGEEIWNEFPGWVPHEWEDTRLQNEWMLGRFTGPGQEELYLPVQDLEL